MWTIDRYDDKDNDELIFFKPPKKQIRFHESANQIWSIDRYDDKENDKLNLFKSTKSASVLKNQKIKFGRLIDMMIKKMTN